MEKLNRTQTENSALTLLENNENCLKLNKMFKMLNERKEKLTSRKKAEGLQSSTGFPDKKGKKLTEISSYFYHHQFVKLLINESLSGFPS